MLLTVPVSQADKHLIPTVIKAFSILPPGSGHDLLIVGQSKVTAEINALQTALSPYFRSSSNLILTENVNLGWPREGNFLFQRTAYHVASHYSHKEAFFWFELDCAPMKPDWLTTLAAAYFADNETALRERRAFRRYMGAKMPTLQTKAGELMPSAEAGHHMAACGFYPMDMAISVKSLNAIPSAGVPFPNFIQWYIVPSNLNDTKLIQDNWRTKNYRAEENVLFSENVSEHAFGIQFNEPICLDGEQVLVHGCKDGSLLTELQKAKDLKEIPPAPQARTNPYPAPEEAFTPAIPQSFAIPQVRATPSIGNYAAPPLPAISPSTYRPPLVIPDYSRDEIYRMPEGQKPLNAYSVGNIHQGETTIAPKIEAEMKQFQEKSRELYDSCNSPEKLEMREVLLNNKPVSPRLGVKRGPYKKKKNTRILSPEERQRRSDRMKEVAKLAHAAREAKKAAQNG